MSLYKSSYHVQGNDIDPEWAREEHTVANTGPTKIRLIGTGGLSCDLLPGGVATDKILRIEHEPKGRVEYTVRPADK